MPWSGPDWGSDLNWTEPDPGSVQFWVQFSHMPWGLVRGLAWAGYVVNPVRTELDPELVRAKLLSNVIILCNKKYIVLSLSK